MVEVKAAASEDAMQLSNLLCVKGTITWTLFTKNDEFLSSALSACLYLTCKVVEEDGQFEM